jgi:hypothetical protein
MKKVILFLISFLCFSNIQAQINELGLFVGGSNFIGDVGSTTYINPNRPAIGLLYKWNKTPRHAWRISFIQSKIESKDSNSKEIRRRLRNYSFQNNIKELSAGIEFNFFDFNINNPLDRKLTPYLFTGLNFSFYDGLFYQFGQAEFDSKQKTIALPIILGVKSNLTSNFVLGFEIGTRYTFADDMDGSFPKNIKWQSNSFGNLNNNDWYVFSGLTLTYTFGTKPCFCAE